MAWFCEFCYFFLANLRASYFGGFLLAIFLLTEVYTPDFIARYDFIFLAAVFYQAAALVFRLESWREFAVIVVFHALATLMELFKTNPGIGSWAYPGISGAFFVIATVPLFSGFLYSAVGSYISGAFKFLRLYYVNFPPYYHLWTIAVAIYVNFFTHHYLYDIRYILFAYIIFIFWRTKVYFRVYKEARSIPFLLSVVLTALFVWLAENIGTVTGVWLYPDQVMQWQLVSPQKLGSWFLLLVLSFALVTIINRDKLQSSTN